MKQTGNAEGAVVRVTTVLLAALLCIFFSGCAFVETLGHRGKNAIVCWGDSMTEGNEGVSDRGDYPRLLEQQIGSAVINEGVGGETSSQIGVRQGGVQTHVMINGEMLPGGTKEVTVSFEPGYEPLTSPHRQASGSILGVEGVLRLSGPLPNGAFTFTPVPGSSSVSAPGKPLYIPDSSYADFLPIFWEGRNNLFKTDAGPWGPSQILSDIAAEVKAVPALKTYLVLSVLNENGPSERRGQPRYETLMELNHSLESIYGDHYLDIRSVLVNSYDRALPVDVSDHDHDMPPTSLGAISAEGSLATSIGKTDTMFVVNLALGGMGINHNLVVDNESIHILRIDGATVIDSIRGYGGILSSHSAGAHLAVYDGTHLNKDGNAVVAKAVAAKLASLSTTP